MFSVYLSIDEDEDDSEIIFGGYNPDRVGYNPFYWEPITSKTAWSIKVNRISYGDVSITTSREMVLNTTEPYIVISRGFFFINLAEFTAIERYMRGILECGIDSDALLYCYVSYNSYSDFEDLKFNIETTVLTIPLENFIMLV